LVFAHEFAYHVLKREHFKKAISQNIRHRKHNRNVLLINGARAQESTKRKQTIGSMPIRADGPNIWVNIINDWFTIERNEFLEDYERNPIYDILHRSGECLCGCTQYPYQETRKEASYWFPAWGKWLDNLEQRACERGFCWKWGEDLPPDVKAKKKRKKAVDNGQSSFMPMCHSCEWNFPAR